MNSPIADADTTQPEPAAPAALPSDPEPPRFCRDPEHRIVGGVAAGLAGATGIHVVAIRIALVVAALMHGFGILAYLAAWVALPRLDDAASGRRQRWPAAGAAAAVGLAFLALLILLIPFGDELSGAGVLIPVALVGIAIALWQPTPRLRVPLPSRSATDALPALTTPRSPTGRPAPAEMARTERVHSVLGRLTLAAALLVVGVALVLDRARVVAVTAGRGASLILLVVGCGLLVATFAGRARWLALVVIALVPVTLVLGTADRMGLDPFVPGRELSDMPRTAAQVQPLYEHQNGSVLLDLSQADFSGASRTVTVHVGIGDVTVLVGPGVAVTVDGQTAIGQLNLLGGGEFGFDHRDTASLSPPNPKGQLRLHLRTGFGSVAVVVISQGGGP